MRRRSGILGGLLAAGWWCALAFSVATVQAHELGTTRVHLALAADGSYVGEVETDAAALLEKLDAMSEPGTAPPGGGLADRIRALDGVFWSRVTLAFDGAASAPAPLSVTVRPPLESGGPAIAHVRWQGRWPAAARVATWSYGWTFASYTLTSQVAGAAPVVATLDGGTSPTSVALTPQDRRPEPTVHSDRNAGHWRLVVLGVTSVWPFGSDHVLFVIGLLLLAGRSRVAVAQLGAFTLAQALTIAAGTLAWLPPPGGVVQPLIALSVACIALANLAGLSSTAPRLTLVCGSGLVHGCGLAGVLGEAAVPVDGRLPALLAFNGGVALGYLAVLAAVFLLLGPGTAMKPWYRERIAIPASLLMAVVAAYWTLAMP